MLSSNKPTSAVSQATLRLRECRQRKHSGDCKYSFVCVVCEAVGSSNYRQTKSCKPCRQKARAKLSSLNRGSEAIGTKLKCRNCGVGFAKVHKRQHYCSECLPLSAANKLPASIEWNRNYQREYQKRRRCQSVAAAINSRISAGIKNSLKDTKNGRSWETLVGFNIAELMVHLERQFLPGMAWGNRQEWHIDHILPLSSFKFRTPDCEGFKAAWALHNLRPLWARDNIRKKDIRTHLI